MKLQSIGVASVFSLLGLVWGAAFLLVFVVLFSVGLQAETKILNASYDVSREFYTEYNQAFAKYYKAKTGEDVTIDQSHGGSSKQARAILDGLEADVATLNQETDINILVKGGFVSEGWKKRFPDNSAPYRSTIIFLVRKGNPKGIKDWDDLAREGVRNIVPNPKTSGNGRYSYLAVYAYAQRKFKKDPKQVNDFVSKVFHNVPVFDGGGRAATTTFVQRGIGDVLLTFESEVFQIAKVFNPNEFEVVVPSISVIADNPVAVVDRVAIRRGTGQVADEYLRYLWSNEGQKLASKFYFRTRQGTPSWQVKLELLEVDQEFGGWTKAQKTHFDDGALYDKIYNGS